MKDKKVLYITQTAVMLAFLIVVQFATRSLGQFVTGSAVNLILLAAVFLIGIWGGLTVALVSPFLAFFVGIGPAFIQVVPFVALGNALFVIIAWLLAKSTITETGTSSVVRASAGLVAASAVKCLFLWLAVALVAIPLVPGLKEKQIAVLSAAFSWPQLVTALIGSALAFPLVRLVRKAIKR